jgi:hypothetical protein
MNTMTQKQVERKIEQCPAHTEIFSGVTHLHLGKKHTFGDIADAILDRMTEVEAKCLINTIKLQMTQPRFLKQEAEWSALKAKIAAEDDF